MILNTLHAITLAISVGINTAKTNYHYGKPNLEKQEATQSNNYLIGENILYNEWQTTTETKIIYSIPPQNQTWQVKLQYDYQKFSFNNSYISVQGVWIRETPKSYTYINSNTYTEKTWIGADGVEIGHTANPKVDLQALLMPAIHLVLPVPAVAQEMILYKIMPTGNNINNVTEYIERYVIEQQTNKLGMYTKRFSTRSMYMEQFFPLNDIEISNYIKNDNLYDKLIEMISKSGYTSYVKDDYVAYDTDWSYESDTQIIMNNTNYYACYIEPKSKIAETTNTYVTTEVWDTQEDSTIRIEGTNVVVSTHQEIIDVPGVMFTVLGMPFTFISTAFNLTLFPGTPYELNISLLFLSIFAVIVFIFLIKFILGKVGK